MKFIRKHIFIIYFTSLFLILATIAITPPASGYELSIYKVFSPFFWMLFVVCALCSLIIIFSDFNNILHGSKKNPYIIAGPASIILTNIIFLLLPFFRGYVILGRGNSDILTHIGYINVISNTYNIGTDNFYPIIHIISSIINIVVGIEINNVVYLETILFYVFFIFNIILLSFGLYEQKTYMLLITALFSPLFLLLYHSYTLPSFLSLYTIPLILYAHHKRENNIAGNKIPYSILLIILCIFIVFTHPISSAYLILILLTFWVCNQCTPHGTGSRNYNPLKLALIISIIFCAWYLSFSILSRNIANAFTWFVHDAGSTPINYYSTAYAQASMTANQTIQLIVFRYGAILLYILLTSILILLLIKIHHYLKTEKILRYGALLFTVTLLTFIFFSGNLVETNIIRVSRYAILLMIIFDSIVLHAIFSAERTNNHLLKLSVNSASILVIAFILVISIISFLGTYGSPLSYQANAQLSEMELEGATFTIQKINQDIPISSIYMSFNRYGDYLYGYNNHKEIESTTTIPSHFGYDKNKTIVRTYNFTKSYVIINKFTTIYSEIYPINIRNKSKIFNASDMGLLASDEGLIKLYENGEFEVYMIL